jgi:hypothetical protein
MRKITSAIFFVFFVAAGGNLCASSFSTFPSSPLKISIAIPAESLVFDDLDARDANNNPIRGASVMSQFERLWVGSLNQMLLNSLTPARVRLVALMNAVWDIFSSSIRAVAKTVWREIRFWTKSQEERLRFVFENKTSLALRTQLCSVSVSSGNSFLFLISFVISSTRLLR